MSKPKMIKDKLYVSTEYGEFYIWVRNLSSFPTLQFYRRSETSTIKQSLEAIQTELLKNTKFTAYATDSNASCLINNVEYSNFFCVIHVENKKIKSVSPTARRVKNFSEDLSDAARKKVRASLMNSFKEPIYKFHSDLIIAGQKKEYDNMFQDLETCRNRVEAAIEQVKLHQLNNIK